MCDLPENLQIIKRELSPPTTPEEKSPNSIKAKLNLHVKRRLQDINQSIEENGVVAQNKPSGSDIKQDKPKTTAIRQKRTYHKRTDKNKIVNTTTTLGTPSVAIAATSVGIATTTPQRKYKHKIKQIVTNTVDHQQELVIANKLEEHTSANHQSTPVTTGAISAGDDEEGSLENDLRISREKEKCPDVLAMVLSVKKRALMQEPEIQKFLRDVMEIIKS